jgi:hypothetical protein
MPRAHVIEPQSALAPQGLPSLHFMGIVAHVGAWQVPFMHCPEPQSMLPPQALPSLQRGAQAGGWHLPCWEHVCERQSPFAPHGLMSLQAGEHIGGRHLPPMHCPEAQSPLLPQEYPSLQRGEQATHFALVQEPDAQSSPAPPALPMVHAGAQDGGLHSPRRTVNRVDRAKQVWQTTALRRCCRRGCAAAERLQGPAPFRNRKGHLMSVAVWPFTLRLDGSLRGVRLIERREVVWVRGAATLWRLGNGRASPSASSQICRRSVGARPSPGCASSIPTGRSSRLSSRPEQKAHEVLIPSGNARGTPRVPFPQCPPHRSPACSPWTTSRRI